MRTISSFIRKGETLALSGTECGKGAFYAAAGQPYIHLRQADIPKFYYSRRTDL
jgi:hypothetical protein